MAWVPRAILVAIAAVILTGCASFFRPLNTPISHVPITSGYGIGQTRGGHFGDNLILVTFSGGGTRAAALAYGVLKELRNTPIVSQGKKVSILDEVDTISSVSGGSFTAAYYGLFGDRIFTDFEDVFLKKSIQGILIQKMFDPTYWWRSLSTGFDRTEMAIEYYDSNIFEGKKFRDIDLSQRPFIEINATNLGAGTRFSFIQLYFDMICTDLLDTSVARAVTASSAVPIMFAPVVFKNYAGQCDIEQNPYYKVLMGLPNTDPRIAELQYRVNHYRDQKNHPYVHLIDGGVVDNLGARAMTERLEALQGAFLDILNRDKPRNIVMITVDAEVEPVHSVDESPDKPSLGDTLDAFSNIQFQLFNNETRILLGKRLQDLKEQMQQDGRTVHLYEIPVSFKSVRGKSLKDHLNSLPTSLELSSSNVDLLVRVGGELLRQNKNFKAFLEEVSDPRHGGSVHQGHPITTGKDLPNHHSTSITHPKALP